MNRKEFLSTILALGGTALSSSASISALENKKKDCRLSVPEHPQTLISFTTYFSNQSFK